MPLKYLPNIISLIRLLLVIPFVYFFSSQEVMMAFYIFMIAACSDALDGWIARYFHCQSKLGLMLDPLADKCLIIGAYLALSYAQILPQWLVFLVFTRDLSIILGAFITLFIFKKEQPLRPSLISKLNTLLQMLQIFTCLLFTAYPPMPYFLSMSLLFGVSLTTTLSFVHYLYIWYADLKLQKAL